MKQCETQKEVALRVEDIAVGYGDRQILAHAFVDVRAGEIVTLLGPNGCGKSTLLRSIAGITPSQAGKIFLHSKDITRSSLHDRIAQGLGFLMQGQAVFPSLSVRENLMIAANKRSAREKARDFSIAWETFPDLHPLASRRAGLLSGGERQMLALAMVLVQGATVWLLDEPSAGLASEGVAKIMQLIKDVNQVHGITILMVEQNVRPAVNVAHRTCFIGNRSIAEARFEDTYEPGRLAYIYA